MDKKKDFENNKSMKDNRVLIKAVFSPYKYIIISIIAIVFLIVSGIRDYRNEYKNEVYSAVSDLMISLHAAEERTVTIDELDKLYSYYDEEYAKVFCKAVKTYADLSDFTRDSLSALKQIDSDANIYFTKKIEGGLLLSLDGEILSLTDEEIEQAQNNAFVRDDYSYDTIVCKDGIILVQWNKSRADVSVGRSIIDVCKGKAFVYDHKLKEIIAADESSLIYSNYRLEETDLELPEHSDEVLIGRVYSSPDDRFLGYGVIKEIGTKGVSLCTYVSEEEIKANVIGDIFYPTILKFIFIILFIICTYFFNKYSLKIEEGNYYFRISKGRYISKVFLYRIIAILIVVALLQPVFTYYVDVLINYSRQNIVATEDLQFLNTGIEKNEQDRETISKYFEEELKSIAKCVSIFLDSDGSIKGDMTLSDLKQKFMLDEITIYDVNGIVTDTTTEYTGYTISKDTSTDENILWNILTGGSTGEFYVSDPDKHIYSSAVRRADCPGLVKISASLIMIESILDAITFENAVIDSDFNSTAKAYINSDDESTLYWIYSKSNSISKLENPLIDSIAMNNGYAGVRRINGDDYYINVLKTDKHTLISAETTSNKKAESISNAVANTLQVLLVMILVLLLVCVCKGEEITVSDEYIEENAIKNTDIQLLEKMQSLLRFVFNILLCVCILCLSIIVLGSYFADSNSFSRYLFKGSWEKGFNVFSITIVIMTAFFAILSALIERKLIILLTDSLGSQTATAGRLISSVLRVLIFAFAIFYSLLQLGFDTKTLLASLGVGSLVLGMGAKDIIYDMLAGIFIVFEGHVCVGEWITVDSFHGLVTDIGIRTTKVMDCGLKVKSIPNSEMKNIINYSRSLTYIGVDVAIRSEADLDVLPKLIEDNAERFHRENEFMRGIPSYQNVSSITREGITVRIATFSEEKDSLICARKFNESVYKLLREHDIIDVGTPIKVIYDKQ